MVLAVPKLIVLLLATGVASTALAGSSPAGAHREIEEARRLGRLYNWPAAHPHFAKAERLFEEQGDARNATLLGVKRARYYEEDRPVCSDGQLLRGVPDLIQMLVFLEIWNPFCDLKESRAEVGPVVFNR